MKWPLISKLKGPAQQGAEPTEEELTGRYQYFKRRNEIGRCLFFAGIMCAPAGLILGIVFTEMMGALEDHCVLRFLIPGCMWAGLGFALIDNKKERLNKPLAEMSEQDRAEALRLTQFVPEARKLKELARKQGRALRSFDLEAMRDFQKQRDVARLLRYCDRLETQAPSVSKRETESLQDS